MYNSTETPGNKAALFPFGNISLNYSAVESDDLLLATRLVKEIFTPVVFMLGIIGNTVNLIVLSHKSLKRNMEHIEKSATLGLMSLALSDLLFCCVGFPTLFLNTHGLSSGTNALNVIKFYYEIYKGPLLNVFLFSSTWIITVISSERFVGVCFPYRACTLIKVRRTLFTHALVFVVALLINFPLFFEYRIMQLPCDNTSVCYIRAPSWFAFQETLSNIHLILWLTLGTFVPLFILIFSNASILKAIYHRRHASTTHDSEEHRTMMRLTWLLVAIVLLFFILVCPSMILQMMRHTDLHLNMRHLMFAVAITNLMQALKFASNFLLYCGLHKRFRKILICKMPTGLLSRLTTNEPVSRNRELLLNVENKTNNI